MLASGKYFYRYKNRLQGTHFSLKVPRLQRIGITEHGTLYRSYSITHVFFFRRAPELDTAARGDYLWPDAAAVA